jgi:two-component system response regulator AtoC
VVRISVPPLRERKEDLPLLAGFLLEKLRVRMSRPQARFGAGAIDALMAYSFPGNVRELENVLERALIYAEGDELRATDLSLGDSQPVVRESGNAAASPSASPQETDGGLISLDSVERDAIERALAKWGGNRTKAAEELGISRRTIINKIKVHRLS